MFVFPQSAHLTSSLVKIYPPYFFMKVPWHSSAALPQTSRNPERDHCCPKASGGVGVCTLKSVRFWDTIQRIFAVVLFFPKTPEVLLFQCGTRRNLTSLPLRGTPYPWTDALTLNTSLGDKEIIWSQSPSLKVTGFSFNSSLTMTSLFVPRPVDNIKTRRSRRVHASTQGFHLI